MDLRPDAIAATARWARRFRLRPWRFTELITDVDSVGSTYGRLITRWTRRTPVWRQQPHRGRKRISDPSITPDQVDPWSADEKQLAEESWHVAECPTCDGSKKVDCPTCDGSARVGCVECRGTGQVASRSAKNHRMVSCRKCRGTGTMKCLVCRNGRVPCPPCDAKGKLEVWIAIEQQRMHHVGVWPSGVHNDAHPGINEDSGIADSWPGALLAESVDEGRQLGEADAGPLARQLRFSSAKTVVEPRLDPKLDRLNSQSLRVYEAPVTRVAFAFSGKPGELRLLGRQVEPTPEYDATPFKSYRSWITTTTLVGVVAAFACAIAYLSRDRFYGATVGWFFLAMAAAAVGSVLFVAGWRRRSIRRLGFVGGFGAVVVAGALATAGTLAATVRPSAAEASAAVEQGDYTEAERHLEAIDRLMLSDDESRGTWVALLEAQASEAANDTARLAMLPAQGERFGDVEQLVALRRDARVRLFEVALDAGDLEAAGEQYGGLLGEHGGDAPELQRGMRERLYARASDLLANDPAAAEKVLSIGWAEWSSDPEYLALGERAVLGLATKQKSVGDVIATLRRAEKLDASDTPEQLLEAAYQSQIKGYQGDTDPKAKPELATLDVQRDELKAIRRLFPEHAEDVGAFLEPIDEQREVLLEEQRKAEERERAKAERERAKAERKRKQQERRGAKKAKARAAAAPVQRTCCKVCSKGKPCGDSCIARNKTCHKGRGCAC